MVPIGNQFYLVMAGVSLVAWTYFFAVGRNDGNEVADAVLAKLASEKHPAHQVGLPNGNSVRVSFRPENPDIAMASFLFTDQEVCIKALNILSRTSKEHVGFVMESMTTPELAVDHLHTEDDLVERYRSIEAFCEGSVGERVSIDVRFARL
ncbi:hypothetical protein [Marinobacter sp. MBR-105]